MIGLIKHTILNLLTLNQVESFQYTVTCEPSNVIEIQTACERLSEVHNKISKTSVHKYEFIHIPMGIYNYEQIIRALERDINPVNAKDESI